MSHNEPEHVRTASAPEPPDAGTTGEDDPPAGSRTDPLSKDVLFDLLSNWRRREALRYLEANGGEADLGDVAEYVAAKENDTVVEALSSRQRKRVYIGLYQSHLPKMDDAGVVDFEKRRGTVELRPRVRQLDPYLEGSVGSAAPDADRQTRHLLLAGVVAVCVTAGLLGIPPFSSVPPAGWAALSALSILVVVESHRRRVE
jgi:hypothetical protein